MPPPAPIDRRVRGWRLALAAAGLVASTVVAVRAEPDPADSLTLAQAVATALEHNPDARAAAERIGEAEAQLGEATAAFYPRIDARLGFERTDNPAQAFAMILNQRRFTPDLNFNNPGPTQDVRPEIYGVLPLFHGGQDYYRRQAAALGVEAARLERLALRNALTEAVIASYYALLAAPQQAAAARASVSAVSSALQHAQTRFAAGAALKSDVLSLDVRLAEAREIELRATNAVDLARTSLRTLLGLPASAALEISPTVDPPALPLPPSLEAALDGALRTRPELGAAARQVAMREREIAVERAEYLPRIDVAGGYANDSSNFELSHESDSWAVGATAQINLFAGFKTQARVRAAEHRLAQARETERKLHLEIEREVQSAFLTDAEARQRVRVSEAAVASAEDALRLVNEQYGAGTATVTRYLEAEAARSAARSRAIAGRYDARRAAAALQKAMGAWATDEDSEL